MSEPNECILYPLGVLFPISYCRVSFDFSRWRWYFPVPAQSKRLLAYSRETSLTIIPTNREGFGQPARLLTIQTGKPNLLMTVKKQHKIKGSSALLPIKSIAILSLTVVG